MKGEARRDPTHAPAYTAERTRPKLPHSEQKSRHKNSSHVAHSDYSESRNTNLKVKELTSIQSDALNPESSQTAKLTAEKK